MRSPEEPVEMVEGALTLVEAHLKLKSIELIRQFGKSLPLIVVDRQEIQQAVINLCINAIDAMAPGGTLTVTLSSSPAGISSGYVEIAVQDTGSGIPREIRDQIFEPFFTTKDVGKGTGLGLSLVFDIVQKHHGTLTLDSEEGKGSLFTIRLPLSAASEPAPGTNQD